MDLPFECPLEQQPQVILSDGLEYRVEKGVAGRRVVTEHDLRITAEFVPAEHMSRFSDAVDEMLATMGTTITQPAVKPADSSSQKVSAAPAAR
jgi:hypothetical protein